MLPYTPVNWQDKPSTDTPLSAANLNRMDQGIKDAHDMLDAATNNQTAGTLVRRDGAGRARFADPSHDQDAATRGWVLQQIQEARPVLWAKPGTSVTAAQLPDQTNVSGDILHRIIVPLPGRYRLRWRVRRVSSATGPIAVTVAVPIIYASTVSDEAGFRRALETFTTQSTSFVQQFWDTPFLMAGVSIHLMASPGTNVRFDLVDGVLSYDPSTEPLPAYVD